MSDTALPLPDSSNSCSTVPAESQALLHRLAFGNGAQSVDSLGARVRSSATGSPASGTTSSFSVEDPADEQRPPQPQGDAGAWKYLVALCALSVVVCYAGEFAMVRWWLLCRHAEPRVGSTSGS